MKPLPLKRKLLYALVALGILLCLAILLINYEVAATSADAIYSQIEDVPSADTALIPGALVYTNGGMSDILKDRVTVAANLYKAGKVKHLLVSGDHAQVEYDEVNIIKDHLLEMGIPASVIFLDHAGLDTYDSLYRARDVFEVPSLIIVSQNFHLPRAVYIGKNLGIETYGLSSDLEMYLGEEKYELREKLANVKAFANLLFTIKPTFLGDPIPITGPSVASWDEPQK